MSEAHLPHIANYRILTEADPSALGQAVETAIHNGWQPFGSLSVSAGEPGGLIYAQPVVKYAEWFR